jgi:hypothetical protein
LGLAGLAGLAPAVARAQAVARERNEPEPETEARAEARDRDPLRGSKFIFDQSITTSTADAGLLTPQSYVPFYGWWLSLRPRWNFNENLRLQLRFDFYKEFTNLQTTTLYRENVFDDIWTDLVYSTPLARSGPWKHTNVGLGARALWPTSKASSAQGVYVTLGATGRISQDIPLRGEDAAVLNAAHVGLSVVYLHPFSDSTTPYNTNFSYTRENTDAFSFPSHELSGKGFAEHTLYGFIDAGLDITPKLSLGLYAVLINQWFYPASDGPVTTGMGPYQVSRINDNLFAQETWLILSADYEVVPEFSVGIGYFNLATYIAQDGTARTLFGGGQDSLLWSPDARFFVDLTANLDKIYEDATGKYKSKPSRTGAAARAGQIAASAP